MKYIDFEYDGMNLSDFGFIVCVFEGTKGLETVSAGSKISFTKVARDNGRYNNLVSTDYNECITATFDICKDPSIYHTQAEMYVTHDEYRDIMRWLNRREFLPLRFIPDLCNEEDIDTFRYNASFNIDKLKASQNLLGLRLTMETDKPFGYGDTVTETLTYTNSVVANTVIDYSDDIGTFYPDLVITVGAAGNLTLTNETFDIAMVIKNCSANEVITIHGQEQIITTNKANHDVANDFNYEFIKIGNTYNNRDNVLACNLPCNIELSYTPIIKDTP